DHRAHASGRRRAARARAGNGDLGAIFACAEGVRKVLAVAAGIALLVVLYGAAGTWLAPRFVRNALVDLAASKGFSLELRTNPFALRVVIEGLALRGPENVSADAKRASADFTWASLWRRGWTYEAEARLAGGGQIASRGTVAFTPLAAEGTLSVTALPLAQLLPQAQGQLEGTARYVYADGRMALQQVAAQANVAPHGRISAQGSIGFAPIQADLKVQAQAVPLAPAQRWLPKHVALRIHSGSFSGEGRLRLGKDKSAYQGSAAIDALRLEERDSGALLLAWQRAETEALNVGISPFSLEIDELVARAPQGRLVIAPDGTVNFAAMFAGSSGEGAPLQAGVRRLRIEKCTLLFADRSLSNPFEVTLRELS